jgi:CRISPR-associated endoribonuclease Cas6
VRLRIEFEPVSGNALLDGQFPRHFQAAIYSALDPELADFVHNRGFKVAKRALRMIVFSDVLFSERPVREPNGLRFRGPASIVIASPMHEIVSSFATSLLKTGSFRVGDEWFNVIGVNVEDPRIDEDYIVVRTLSPIVVYSTLFRPDGRKYTCYFQPGESDFARLVAENLNRKYQAVYGQHPVGAVKIDVRRCGRMVIRTFKGTVVKGWHCTLGLHGASDLLKLALDAGLGSKNAQGWGCVERMVGGKRDESCG